MERSIALSALCQALSLKYVGEDVCFDGLGLCNRSSAYHSILSYVTTSNYVDTVCSNTAVTGLVLAEKDYPVYEELLRQRNMGAILCEKPEKIFYDIHDYLYYQTDFYDKFNWPSKIGVNTSIHPSAVIEDGVIIGDDVVIEPNAVVRRGTIIGNRCVIGCNSTVGSEGFQVLRIDGKNRKIVHCGGVLLGDDVWVGDNTAVAKALFEGVTAIGNNCKIDNCVHVGHNVLIGADVVVTPGVILCGSAVLESDSWIGASSSVLNRVTIGTNAKVGMSSVVTRDIPPNTLAYGSPARPVKENNA